MNLIVFNIIMVLLIGMIILYFLIFQGNKFEVLEIYKEFTLIKRHNGFYEIHKMIKGKHHTIISSLNCRYVSKFWINIVKCAQFL